MPRCKLCKDKFEPKVFLQKYCLGSVDCINAAITENREKIIKKQKREWNVEKRERKEKLKSNQDHVKELQVIFNTFIRTRDKDKPCISCGEELKGKFDAGHYFSAGGNPSVRFHEDNVHGQCVYCNQHKHGNLHNYYKALVKKIGFKAVEKLEMLRNEPRKYTIPELLQMKIDYKQRIKKLNG